MIDYNRAAKVVWVDLCGVGMMATYHARNSVLGGGVVSVYCSFNG